MRRWPKVVSVIAICAYEAVWAATCIAKCPPPTLVKVRAGLRGGGGRVGSYLTGSMTKFSKTLSLGHLCKLHFLRHFSNGNMEQYE